MRCRWVEGQQRLTARFEDLIKGWNHTVWNVLLALRLVESAQFLKAQLQNQPPPPSTTPSDCFALVSGRFGGVRLGFETDSMFFTLEGAGAQESCACRACGLGPWGLQSLQETVAGSHIGGRSWLLRLRMIDLEYPLFFFEVRGGLHALNSPSLSCHA